MRDNFIEKDRSHGIQSWYYLVWYYLVWYLVMVFTSLKTGVQCQV